MQRSVGAARPAPVFDAPRSKVLRDEVVAAIERAILRGDVAPGQRLVEDDVAHLGSPSRVDNPRGPAVGPGPAG